MAAIEKGRICVIKKGSRAGTLVTVVEVVSSNMVKVKDKNGKERVMNILHLEPMEKKVDAS